MACGIGRQPSLRDSRLFRVPPSVETLGYSRLSLRDSKVAVFPCRQNGPGVQQYDLWAMPSSPGERVGVRGTVTLVVRTTLTLHLRFEDRPKGRIALSHSSFRASGFAEGGGLLSFVSCQSETVVRISGFGFRFAASS